jgi:hypothetical protein
MGQEDGSRSDPRSGKNSGDEKNLGYGGGRDELLFVMGINTTFRIGDLLKLAQIALK